MKFTTSDNVEMVFIYFENNKSQRATARIFGELHPERPTPNNNVIG